MMDMQQVQQPLPIDQPFPIGATVMEAGVNFSLFSKNGSRVELLLFDHMDAERPSRVLEFDSRRHRTGFYWHRFVPGLRAGQVYGYRVYGPHKPEAGHRFDPQKVLLDPYSKLVAVPKAYDRNLASVPGDNTASAMKSIVVDPGGYDWEGDQHPRHPFTRTIIYELHVAGFTRHPNSDVAAGKRGTYAGLIEKIPYLQDLGVTAVELLPVFQFDAQDAPPGQVNYWGYSPVSFFAPHRAYSSRQDPLGPMDEFRDMVKALHRAGIEVILDVVYNHTAEGDQRGPTFCFRGMENRAYYLLDQADRAQYANFSGTGNTVNANHSIVRRMIMDSLRYWVAEMHVDGFRFDLASILSRDEFGNPISSPPILWEIESDPVLAGTKLIAEAWDAAGLYQVGSFTGDRWQEWNGRFRDDIRRFVKGDRDTVSSFASRILASPDVYSHKEQQPEASINFVTCHDGFTLNDLVSYNRKHNEANGEENQDGTNNNLSWNCGVEGPTDDPAVEQLRLQQIRNFFTITLLAYGTPMLLMGDEVRRTQHGNNNAYCQDNETSWFDWDLVRKNAGLHRFVKLLNTIRLQRDISLEDPAVTLTEFLQSKRLQWHGIRLNEPDWRSESHSIACTAWTHQQSFVLHLMFNAYHEDLLFELPDVLALGGAHWRRLIDTSLASPEDINRYVNAQVVHESHYLVRARSVVVLIEAPARKVS